MSKAFTPVLKESKLIMAILPKGISRDVIKKLHQEKDINNAQMHYARGVGKLTPLKYRVAAVQPEKEVLTVIVDAERSDEIFDYIYEHADVNKPHGGLMYMHELMMSTEYQLPDITEEES